jgi:hypothetical protein
LLVDPVGRVVVVFDQQQQLGEGVVLADQALGQPLAADGQQVGEQPGFDVLLIVPEMVFQQAFGKPESDLLGAFGPQVVQAVDDGLADDGGVLDLGGDVGGGQLQLGLLGELGGQTLAGQFVAVAVDAGEGDFAGDPVLQGADAGRDGAGLGIGGGSGGRDEREGDAVDFGVLDGERLEGGGGSVGQRERAGLGMVAHAAQATSDDLFAQQLGAEGPHAQDVGDGVGVPAFGEHRDGDDALDVFAQFSGLADRVQDFAQQVFVGQFVGSLPGKRRR